MPVIQESNFVSVVVYLRNGAETVEKFLRGISGIFEENFKKYEMIFVDDASEDRSVDIVKSTATDIAGQMVSVLHMSNYQGIEQSMNAGSDLAIGDFVFEFDNPQLDFDPQLIMEVYRRALQGFDIVSAAPDTKGRSSSRLFYWVFNRYSNTGYPLRTESFRVLSRRVINRVQAMSRSIPYRKAVYANSGLKQDAIFYTPSGSLSALDQKEAEMRRGVATDSLILFTDVAYKASRTLAILLMLLTLGVCIYAAVIYLGGGKPVEGWTTTILFLSAAFFGVFGILSILIKYLSLAIQLLFQRQSYTIESIEKITQ